MFPLVVVVGLAVLFFAARKAPAAGPSPGIAADPSAGYAVVDPSRVSKSTARPTLAQLATLGPGSLVDVFMTKSGDTSVIQGRLRLITTLTSPGMSGVFDSVTATSPISFVPGTPTPAPGTVFSFLPTDIFYVVPKTEIST